MTAHDSVRAASEASIASQQKTLDKSNNDASYPNISSPDTSVKDTTQAISVYSDASRIAWDWICWSGAKTFDGMDFAGEVIADFLGLTRSKYQWIIDAHERDEEERRLRKLEARQRRQLRLEQLLKEEQRKLQELEIGALEESA